MDVNNSNCSTRNCSTRLYRPSLLDHSLNKTGLKDPNILCFRNMPIRYHVVDARHDGVWKSCESANTADLSTDLIAVNQDPVAVNSTGDTQTPDEAVQLVTEHLAASVLESGVQLDRKSNEVDDCGITVTGSLLLNSNSNSTCSSHSYTNDKLPLSTYPSCVSVTDMAAWNDPVNFIHKRMTATLINSYIDKPNQPDDAFNFPVTNGRQFMASWFYSCMPDGSKVTRKWLSYSAAENKAYCVNCVLFGGPNASKLWTTSGFNGWISRHGIRDIIAHETTDQHRFAETGYIQWITSKRIDRVIEEQTKSAVDQNRRVVCVVIKAIQYLATEMIAIRGHSANEGKLMNLFKLLAQYDANAAAYLESLEAIRARETRKKPAVNFLSPLNVRRLLTVMKTLLVERVIQLVNKQRACSIISDGTQDESKMEAQCLTIRYLEESEGMCRPVERLIDVFTTGDTSAESLCDNLINSLNKANVNLEFIVGQSYDGASNMRGRHSGLRTRMLQYANRALFVWCHAHRFNLVIESMLGCCTDIRKVLGLIQEMYNFFNSHRRHAVLMQFQGTEAHKRTLKRVSDTTRSWRSAEDGVTTLIQCFNTISKALECLENDANSDTSTVSIASGLLRRLNDFHLIVNLHILKFVFCITGPVSRIFQGVSVDIAMAVTLIESCLAQFNDAVNNCDAGWERILKEAKDFAELHDVESTFPVKRQRKPKKMSGELASDESIEDPARRMKTTVFKVVIDNIYVQLKERFQTEDLALLRSIKFFTPACLTSSINFTEDDIKEVCQYYGVDTSVIIRELTEFRAIYKQLQTHVQMDDLTTVKSYEQLAYPCESVDIQHSDTEDTVTDEVIDYSKETKVASWIECGFVKPLRLLQQLSGFTTLQYVYKILVTLPVTSCSAERTMSRVRIVKNRLRSTMLDDWFS
jgi:Domain of unknown function (DUF4371)